MTEAERHRIIAAIVPLIEAHYVFPETGSRMISDLRERDARGEYSNLTDERAFARRVTDDLRAVSHDLHVILHYDGDPTSEATAEERAAEQKLASNFGFVSTARLPGNVALLRIDSFLASPGEPGVKEAYARRLGEIADASALILDLRANEGGDSDTVALLLSYLFGPTKVQLSDIWIRNGNKTWSSFTDPHVKGAHFGGEKPLYVLASKETFSAGEAAAYDLQASKRATVVGEPTAGGANPAPRHKLSPRLTFAVPFGRAINPVTHTNWEGVGVKPDVVVDPKDAVNEAHRRALRDLLPKAPHGAARKEVETALANLDH